MVKISEEPHCEAGRCILHLYGVALEYLITHDTDPNAYSRYARNLPQVITPVQSSMEMIPASLAAMGVCWNWSHDE